MENLLHHSPLVRQTNVNHFINNLPPELLSRIFELGCVDPETDSESGDEGDEGPQFEILVSHVCRHWRAVALSTPSLWTSIEATLEAHPSRNRVSTLLERSRSAPIDVYCDFDNPTDDEHFDYIKNMISMLTPHIHRWRTMEFSVCDYRYIDLFFSAISDPSVTGAPQLTTLALYHFDLEGIMISPSQNFTLFGGSAPLLTSLVLWGVHVDWSLPWITFAPNLEELELAFHAEVSRPSWAQFTSLLRSASALKSLSLRESGPSGDPAEWFIEPTPESPADLNAPVNLPFVMEFILGYHSQAYVVALLRKFHLPVVKTLSLEFRQGDYTDFIRELAGSATCLSPTHGQQRSLLSGIETLRIRGLPCRSTDIQMLYDKLQNLTSLTLLLSDVPTMYLDVLCAPCTMPGSNVWLPRLARLSILMTSGDVLRKLVERRVEAGAPLEYLSVMKDRGLKEEDMEWLKKNVKTFHLS